LISNHPNNSLIDAILGPGAGELPRPEPNTQFRIGSITKTMTAALILALRDEGRLALDVATFVFTREPWPAR
jgi:Beta-lactamase